MFLGDFNTTDAPEDLTSPPLYAVSSSAEEEPDGTYYIELLIDCGSYPDRDTYAVGTYSLDGGGYWTPFALEGEDGIIIGPFPNGSTQNIDVQISTLVRNMRPGTRSTIKLLQLPPP